MFGYIFILIANIVLWIVILKKSEFELFSPSSISLLGMIASVTLAMIGLSSWNDVILAPETIAIVIVGELAFVTGSLAVIKIPAISKLFQRQSITANVQLIKRTPESKAFLRRCAALAIVLVIAIVLRIIETYQIANSLGISGSSLFEISKEVRDRYAVFMSSDSIKIGVGYSMLERQLEKIVTAIGFVSAFLLGRSVPKARNDIHGLLAILVLLSLCIFNILLTGSRGTILYLAIAAVTSYAISAFNVAGDHRRLALHLLAFCAILAVLAALVFYFLSFVVNQRAGSGLVEYISFYFGCGVPSLERLIEKGVATSAAPGTYTFYNLAAFFYKIGLIEEFPSYSLTWVQLESHSSNVFTCFARYYVEFGITGVIVFSALSGAILSFFYNLARQRGSNVCIALEAFFTPYIFDMAREEFVFSRALSVTYLLIIALIVIITFYMTDPSPVKTVKSWCAQRGKAK